MAPLLQGAESQSLEDLSDLDHLELEPSHNFTTCILIVQQSLEEFERLG